MSEWAKIVVSVVAGMFAAIFADTLKSWLADGRRTSRIRRLLRLEMNALISEAEDFYGLPTNQNRTSRIRRLHTPVYDYYSTVGKAQFVELYDAWIITEVYERYVNFMSHVDSTPDIANFEAKRFLQHILLCAKHFKLFGQANYNIVKALTALPGITDDSSFKNLVDY